MGRVPVTSPPKRRKNYPVADLWNLRQLNLFAGLKPTEIDEILRIVTVKGFKSGELIFSPSDAPDRLYLLHSGQVKTYVLSPQGQEKIMHVFHPGDAFGGLLLGTTYGELPWAQALGDVVVSCMDETAFKRFMQIYPDLCMNLFRYMADHHAADMRRLESFLHANASQRLVLALLELGNRLGQSEAGQFEIPSYFTHEDLANMIGVVRSTASLLISQLRQAGVLGGQGRCLIVHRRVAEEFLIGEPHA